MLLRESEPTGVDEEDRILRVWTPVLLRTILIVATIVLIVGLVAMATQAPGAYVSRYRQIQSGHEIYARASWVNLFTQASHGHPHAIVTIGLMVLTLVPLARVAFCFALFLKKNDWIYVLFTAYVLIGLIVGVVVGRIG
ncbi:MAG: DUF1634 domain-containing protein [Candidatus Binataceae bacterium]